MPERVNGSRRDWPRGLLVLGGLILRDLWRPPPEPLSTRQRLAMLPDRLLPVSKAVTVRWDTHQIPFIEAASERDLAVALGVVHAHLRLGQIEMMRRIAGGRIAEMVGPLGIELDRTVRLLELGRAVPEMIASLPDETRQWAEGFVAGINHHLTHAKALPREFAVLRMRPEPWTLTDLMTLMRLSSVDLSWLIWSKLLRLRDRTTPAAWAPLWRKLLSGAAPPSFGSAGEHPASWACAAMARSGSNAAAIGAARTGTGAALIASDPHLPYGLPNPWVIVGMRSPRTHCVSLMMPGLPFMALGRNPHAAWGGTSLHAQSSDLFDISGLASREITERVQTLRVRGAPDRTIRLRRTAHGPVVSEGLLLPSRRPLALRWMGHRASDELSAMLAVARCRDFSRFREALEGFGVSGLNMLFAGRDGSVGHLLAAHLPDRGLAPPPDLHLPLEASSAWQATVRASGLPVRGSPDHSVVVSANQRPEGGPEGCAVAAGFFFSPPDRALRITRLLEAPGPVGMERAAAMQRDVLGERSLELRDLLLARAGTRRASREAELLDLLSGWDGGYRTDSRGALAFELLLAGVVRYLGGRRMSRAYDVVWMTQPLLLEDLRALPDARLREAVGRALPRAARRLKRHRNWGRFHRIVLAHPLGRLPLLGRRYAAPGFAAEGSNNTVHKTAHRIGAARHRSSFGSCARHISDLSDPDANLMVLLGGQDGWLGSENFDDLTRLWRQGRYVRLPLRPESVRSHHRETSVLRPD